MPSISRLLIHPIKSLDAQEVVEAEILPSGAIAHDRAYAIVDTNGRFVNGKQHASVHQLRTRLDVESGRLSLRDESKRGLESAVLSIDSARGAIVEWLGDFFAFRVALDEDRRTGFPDDPASPGPTIIAASTLATIARWFALPIDQVRARFRTNIEIDDVPPFWEDRLFGTEAEIVPFSLGTVGFNGINPCQRCIVPTRHPWTGAADRTFARRFSAARRDSLPAWTPRERFDHFFRAAVNTRVAGPAPGARIAVGDHVAIGDAAGGRSVIDGCRRSISARPSPPRRDQACASRRSWPFRPFWPSGACADPSPPEWRGAERRLRRAPAPPGFAWRRLP